MALPTCWDPVRWTLSKRQIVEVSGWTSLEGLNVGTVPTLKTHNIGTVPTFKMHNVVTVPIFKMHNVGTVPTNKTHNIGTELSYATLRTTTQK